MSFESLANFFGGDDPDFSLVVTGFVLGITVVSLCWIIPCCPDSTSKDDEPYYGAEPAYVTKIFIYPVKSCAGHAVEEREIVRTGLKYDRLWVVVGQDGRFRSQRRISKMALIRPSLPNELSDPLELEAEGMPKIAVPVIRSKEEGAKLINVSIWSDKADGVDQGDAAAEWLTTFLGEPGLRLVRMDESYVRSTDPKYAKGYSTAFADGFPLLLAAEESLHDLNSRLERKVRMEQFRPNIVVKGMDAWSEDSWTKLSINDVFMRVVKPCSRCKMPTIDQETGEKLSDEPIDTLKTYRTGRHLLVGDESDKDSVYFGQNMVCENTGWIEVGDRIELLRVKVTKTARSKAFKGD